MRLARTPRPPPLKAFGLLSCTMDSSTLSPASHRINFFSSLVASSASMAYARWGRLTRTECSLAALEHADCQTASAMHVGTIASPGTEISDSTAFANSASIHLCLRHLRRPVLDVHADMRASSAASRRLTAVWRDGTPARHASDAENFSSGGLRQLGVGGLGLLIASGGDEDGFPVPPALLQSSPLPHCRQPVAYACDCTYMAPA